MSNFTLLWGKILDSSLWVQESKETRLVWITMLAMKDRHGRVLSSLVGLADRAKVTPNECKAALHVLESPDPNDSSGVDDGRRIRRIDGGWQIVNDERYKFSNEARRESWRLYKEEQRKRADDRTKRKKRKEHPLPGEVKAEEMAREGATQEQIDQYQATTLPDRHPED